MNGATAAAMPLERKRMAGLWEREVGGLPPRSFANAVMASKVFFPSPSSLITYSSDYPTILFVPTFDPESKRSWGMSKKLLH